MQIFVSFLKHITYFYRELAFKDEGDNISTIKSGVPLTPLSVTLDKSHTIPKSGWTTVSSDKNTSNGA
jgi:hypothetical protein